ncbi:MAG: hypothetical protein U7M05_12430 [Candidatus Igneacidithiobacillus chanchocoensis]
MLTTTLNRIRTKGPCPKGWRRLLGGLGKTVPDDEPLAYADILRINGLDDAIWCMRAEPQYAKQWRLFTVKCTRRVQHLMKDPRSIAALDVAERHAYGAATDAELAAAKVAAWEAENATWAFDRGASRDAARAAACAVLDDAHAAAWDATSDGSPEERAEQSRIFLEIVNGE